MASTWWSVWELHGPTRGELIQLVRKQSPPGAALDLVLATVGSSGFWPHVVAFWRSDDAFAPWLEAPLDDGLDEQQVWLCEARLYRTVRGEPPADCGAFLVERFTARDRSALETLAPELLLAEALAPWQGMAVWGARDLDALAARESDGIGARRADVESHTGWWALVPPEREMA